MQYEFEVEDAEQIWIFGNKMTILTVSFALSTFIGIITTIINMTNGVNAFKNFVLLFEFMILGFIAYSFFNPAENFKAIALTEGQDVDELMSGIDNSSTSFLTISLLIFALGILSLVLIGLKIGGIVS